jgi:hypothetical protein
MAYLAVRSGIKSKKDKVLSFLRELDTLSQASILGADLHLNQAVYWLAFLFSMRSIHQLRSVFEEGVLAHQQFDAGLAMGIRIFPRLVSLCVTELAALNPHIPWTPLPGGVGEKQR